jgi:hypothetical protein
VEKTGEKRPWKSQERFPLSHSFNNNKLDDRDHFQQNAKTSVASLRGLIGSSRNIDWHHSGMLIAFIGIPTVRTLGCHRLTSAVPQPSPRPRHRLLLACRRLENAAASGFQQQLLTLLSLHDVPY